MSALLSITSAILGLPNFLGANSPEIYTFDVNGTKYSLVSGVAGIFNHAHKITKVDGPANEKAVFYFTVEKEYGHTHPNSKNLYYVGTDNNIYVFNLQTKKSKQTKFLLFGAGHRHAVNVIKH